MKQTWRKSAWPASVVLGALFVVTVLPVSAEGAVGQAASRIAAGSDPGLAITALEGVFCTSAGNCWAVGQSQRSGSGPALNQLLHWNGKKWHSFRVPQPGGTTGHDYNTLTEVRCVYSRDCWAVGYYLNGGADLDQALHWNGKKWSAVPTPTPGGTLSGDLNELYDVTCAAAASCWAVGEFGTSSTLANQALHWNGKRWSVVRAPDPAGTRAGDTNVLGGVRCTSISRCLAVGFYQSAGSATIKLNEAMRWNGKKWKLQAMPNPGGSAGAESELVSLGCGSSTSCWAVGFYAPTSSPEASLNEILHWNGRKWSLARVPEPHASAGAFDNLFWVTCIASNDCWAVGDAGAEGSTEDIDNQALHWNGSQWRLVHVPSKGSGTGTIDALDGARCTSAKNCWAVGERLATTGFVDEILHWNGNKWTYT